MRSFIKKYFEQIAWAIALCFLYLMDTSPAAASFCIFKWIGFESCMGCGIGHSIHQALHFNFAQAYQEHMMGIPATGLLILQLFKPFFKNKTKYNYHGPTIAYDAKRHAG